MQEEPLQANALLPDFLRPELCRSQLLCSRFEQLLCSRSELLRSLRKFLHEHLRTAGHLHHRELQ